MSERITRGIGVNAWPRTGIYSIPSRPGERQSSPITLLGSLNEVYAYNRAERCPRILS
jgi:hypothetical protein